MKKIAIFILLLGLTGCASMNDVNLMKAYYTANNSHNEEQTAQVSAKAKAIKDAVVINCDSSDPNCAVAKAMAGVVSSMFISGIEAQEFTTDAPTTGVSVQKKALTTIGNGIPWLTIGVVANKGIDSAGDKTTASGASTVNKAGGDVSTSQVENEVVFEPEEVVEEDVIVDEAAAIE